MEENISVAIVMYVVDLEYDKDIWNCSRYCGSEGNVCKIKLMVKATT